MVPEIRIDDLRGPEIAGLLQEHLDEMYRLSPPESVHALDMPSLRQTGITFWTAWDDRDIMGCIALKTLALPRVKSNPCAQRRIISAGVWRPPCSTT